MTYALVIFDCDGVLIHSEPIVASVYAEMLSQLGAPMTPQEALALFSGRSRASNLATAAHILGRPLPEDFASAWDQRATILFRQQLTAIPGVSEAVRALRLPVCVASGSDHATIRRNLAMTGLLHLFEGRIFSSADVERSKPFPDVFLLAAERMGMAPSRCAVVEDSLPGVQAGVAAGMSVFGYARFSQAETLHEAGAKVFFDMADLRELLQE